MGVKSKKQRRPDRGTSRTTGGGSSGLEAPRLTRLDCGLAAGVGLLTILLYGWTCCPTIYWGDSSEFAVIGPTLDIAHPTGYPLFTLLAKLFSMLPVQEPALGVNLLSVTAGALACALVFLLCRLLGVPPLAAAGGALLLAVSEELWEQSSAAEVYSLHLALTAAVFLAALRFHHEPNRRGLFVTAALLGLSFTNHLTTLWTVPAVFWLLMTAPPIDGGQAWWKDLICWLRSAQVFLASVSLYLYLPIRSWMGVLFDHGQPGSLGNLLYHVTGRQFQYRMFVAADKGFLQEMEEFGRLVFEQFSPAFLALAAVGCMALWLRRRPLAVAVGLLAVANLLFDLNYHIPDKQGYYLPVYLVLVIWISEGAWVAAGMFRGKQRELTVIVTALFLGLGIHSGASNWPEVDKSDNRSLPEFTEEISRRLPEGGLLLVDDQFLIWSFNYMQLIEGRHTDRIVVNDYLLCLPWYIAHLKRRYPQLRVPAGIDDLVAARGEEVARARGWEIGDISQRYTQQIAAELIRANKPFRRCFLNFHDFEERKEWQGMKVVNQGLFFEIASPTPDGYDPPWDVDFPDPARYRKGEIHDRHHKHVAGTFSTACNRAGIAFIQAGRLKEAEAAFRRALEHDVDYAQVYLNLGVLYHSHLKDTAQRDQAWSRFLELAPDDPQAGSVRQALGR